MYLAKEKPSAIASRYYALAEAFRRQSARIWQSEYDELAILSLLQHPATDVVAQVLRNQQAIRQLRPNPDRSLAFNLASSVAFFDLIQSRDAEGITDAKAMMDMQAVINAQQAAVIAASTAAVVASTAASSPSSN